MRKAIMLEVRLWIEGDEDAPADFAARTKRAVRDMLEAGAARHPDLAVRVRSVREAQDDT
jgi:hypothetical protein